MFRLFKLALYAVIGYALYQMYLGYREAGERGGEGQASGRGGSRRARSASGQNMTGAGRGVSARTEESSGGSSQHRVGRGIVS
jgi:hypothetical protein